MHLTQQISFKQEVQKNRKREMLVALGALESHFHAMRPALGQQQEMVMKSRVHPVSLAIPACAGSRDRFNAKVLVV